jgi:ribosomal protein S5
MVKATMAALAQLEDPNAIAARRGKELASLVH